MTATAVRSADFAISGEKLHKNVRTIGNLGGKQGPVASVSTLTLKRTVREADILVTSSCATLSVTTMRPPATMAACTTVPIDDVPF